MANSSAWKVPYIDYQSVLVAVFLGLFIVSSIDTNNSKGNVVDPSLFVATIEWSKDSHADVDLLMLLPTGEQISFKSKSASAGNLDFDDLANKEIDALSRRETISLRKIVAGKYIISIILYNGRGEKPSVRANIIKLRGIEIVCEKITVLEKDGQEIPICSFTLDSNGDVTFVDSSPQKGVLK